MEGISITEWINVSLGIFAVLGSIVFALVKNHILLQEASKNRGLVRAGQFFARSYQQWEG